MLQLYEETAVQSVADKIRQELAVSTPMSLVEMPDYIGQLASSFGFNVNIVPSHLDDDGNWVRPEEYEDLSQIELDDFREEVFLSLYNRQDGMWHLGLYVTASKGYKVELGHIVNGQFVSSEEYLKANNAYFEILLPENEETMVARVTSQNPLYGITAFRFGRISKAISGKVIDSPDYQQPVVERIGRLPYVTTLAGSGTSYCYGACYLEHDAVKVGYQSAVTSLANAWQYCYNLQKLDVSDWNTSRWKVSSLVNTFQYCYALETLDLSSWDTENWVVTTLASCWQFCVYLKSLKQNWNTINWKVTTLTAAWNNCISIETLDISNWDTTNWVVTAFGSNTGVFQNCFSLKNFVQNWNTTNWKVTSLQSVFNSCCNLEHIDLTNWDTTNWSVTSLSSAFTNCYRVRQIDISTWNTINWAVTTTASLFANCYNLQSVELSNWDTSNWVVTNMSSTFGQCYSLKSVNLSNWNTTKFAIATGSTFSPFNSTCYSLVDIDMEGWDFSNCKKLDLFSSLFSNCYSLKQLNVKNWKFGTVQFNTLANLFNNCYSLEELDLSTWDTSNWKITATNNMFSYCRSLKNIDLSNWDTYGWPMSGSMEGTFRSCYNLQTLDLSTWRGESFAPTSMRYFLDDDYKLTSVNLSTLNDTSTAYPITLGNTMYSLQEYYPPIKSNQISFTLGTSNNISHDSIMRVINGLPTVSSAKTLTLGILRAKLTADEIAIATQKGWTVA